MTPQALIFVYNANSGAINSLIGTAHKIVSPETYKCGLCALTFGNINENTTWRKFRESSALEMIFLHKDEFLKQYRSKWLPKYDFPIVLLKIDNQLEVFMQSNEFGALDSAQELVEVVKLKFKEFDL